MGKLFTNDSYNRYFLDKGDFRILHYRYVIFRLEKKSKTKILLLRRLMFRVHFCCLALNQLKTKNDILSVSVDFALLKPMNRQILNENSKEKQIFSP